MSIENNIYYHDELVFVEGCDGVRLKRHYAAYNNATDEHYVYRGGMSFGTAYHPDVPFSEATIKAKIIGRVKEVGV